MCVRFESSVCVRLSVCEVRNDKYVQVTFKSGKIEYACVLNMCKLCTVEYVFATCC